MSWECLLRPVGTRTSSVTYVSSAASVIAHKHFRISKQEPSAASSKIIISLFQTYTYRWVQGGYHFTLPSPRAFWVPLAFISLPWDLRVGTAWCVYACVLCCMVCCEVLSCGRCRLAPVWTWWVGCHASLYLVGGSHFRSNQLLEFLGPEHGWDGCRAFNTVGDRLGSVWCFSLLWVYLQSFKHSPWIRSLSINIC